MRIKSVLGCIFLFLMEHALGRSLVRARRLPTTHYCRWACFRFLPAHLAPALLCRRRQDFRFHLEVQRKSANTAKTNFKTASADADRLETEVRLLRKFMSNRLGLDCNFLPTAVRNESNTGASSPTVR